MPLPDDFVETLKFIHPKDLVPKMTAKDVPQGGGMFELRNELRPVDLFCYLGARFGRPNGIQNFLRSDDSDNLIHWDWTLIYNDALVQFIGMNFRTEVFFFGLSVTDADRDSLITQLKAGFQKHGSKMGEVRKCLEHWIEFVNPYQRVRRALDRLLSELNALALTTEPQHPDLLGLDSDDDEILRAQWQETADRYSRGFGLCFGIRSMLPVAAEAFVNLLIYTLMRPEIRRDERLRDNVIRQPIDVRIKSLPINCLGFKQMPDYSSPSCREYHKLVNERNDLLHGNIVIDKLKFNEVYFDGKVPVFRSYRSWWERSLGVELDAVGLKQLPQDIAIVDGLVNYLLSCVHDDLREKLEVIISRYELGLEIESQRVSVLFPPWLVDFRARPVFRDPGSSANDAA
jgi:hypothetical protein